MLCRLHKKTLELLHNRPRTMTYEYIAEQTGLTFWWIQYFAKQKDKDPGVNKVETLYVFLSGRELDL